MRIQINRAVALAALAGALVAGSALAAEGQVVRKVLGPVVAESRTFKIDLAECERLWKANEGNYSSSCKVELMADEIGDELASGTFSRTSMFKDANGVDTWIAIYTRGNGYEISFGHNQPPQAGQQAPAFAEARPFILQALGEIGTHDVTAIVHTIQKKKH